MGFGMVGDILFLLQMALMGCVYFWYFTIWPVAAGIAYAIYTKKVGWAFVGLLFAYVGSLAFLVIYLMCCAKFSFP